MQRPTSPSLVALLLASSLLPAAHADLNYASFGKIALYNQSTSAAPSLDPSTPYALQLDVEESQLGAVTSATLSGGTAPLVAQEDPANAFWFASDFRTSKSSLDAAYPNNAPYTLTATTQTEGTRTFHLALGNDAYPNAPHITNFSALQHLAPNSAFTIHYDPFTNASAADYMYFQLYDANGNGFDLSNRPFVAGPNGLNPAFTPTSTSLAVPNLALPPGLYTAQLVFGKQVATDGTINGIPAEALFLSGTYFPLAVLPTTLLPGDANLDNHVDLADYDLWYAHVGQPDTSFTTGDFNQDGKVDLADYDLWYKHVGATAPLAASPIPEPTSLSLLAAGAAFLLTRRR